MTETERKFEIAKKKKNLINTVRAMSLLLLALLLAIFAAFAWFGMSDKSDVAGTSLAISGSELTVSENDDEEAAPTVNGEVYLPAATKKNDATISESDFSKVLAYKSYTVTCIKDGYVKVSVTKPSTATSDQLHYIITDVAPSDDNWAAAIKGGTVVPDSEDTYVELSPKDSNYEAQVYLVLYGDYADGGAPFTSFTDSPRSDAQGTRKVQFGSLSLDFAYSATDTPAANP